MTDPKQAVLSPEVEEALQTLLSAVGWDSDSVRKAESTLRAALAQQQTKPEGGVVSAGPSGLAEGVRTEPLAPSSGPNPAAGDRQALIAELKRAVKGYGHHLALLDKAADQIERDGATIARLKDGAWTQWHKEHPGKEFGDLHARWWLFGLPYPQTELPFVEDEREVVEAVIAALVQEGVHAWYGDGTSIIAHMISAQSDKRKTAEAALAASNQRIKVLEGKDG